MRLWRSGDLETNGARLHYRRGGAGQTPLVLLHGFSDDGLCWASLAEDLAGDYAIVAIDARGHGQSSAPERGYGPVEQAADVAGVIAGLGLRRPIVIGHSMGAITALALAAAHPGVPRAIVLEDPPPWWMGAAADPPNDPAWQAQARAWIAGLQSQTREAIIEAKRIEAPTWPEADIEPWADAKLRFNLNAFNQDPPPGERLDVEALARRIACPTLLVTGDPQLGSIVRAEQAARLQALVPGLRIVQIGGASHDIRRDQFAAFAAAVRSFIAGLAPATEE